jgi:hypothetical protein
MSALESMGTRYSNYLKEHNLPDIKMAILGIALRQGATSIHPEISQLSADQLHEHAQWLERFQAVFIRVRGEDAVLCLLCTKAMLNGYRFRSAHDGEEHHSIAGNSITEVVHILTAVDESTITFKHKEHGLIISFYLVFGNSAVELIADHTDHPDAELIYQQVMAVSWV